MTTEYIYHCEGPDCGTRAQSLAHAPLAGWIQVFEGKGPMPDLISDFCSWDCLLRFAAKVEPAQVIQTDGRESDA